MSEEGKSCNSKPGYQNSLEQCGCSQLDSGDILWFVQVRAGPLSQVNRKKYPRVQKTWGWWASGPLHLLNRCSKRVRCCCQCEALSVWCPHSPCCWGGHQSYAGATRLLKDWVCSWDTTLLDVTTHSTRDCAAGARERKTYYTRPGRGAPFPLPATPIGKASHRAPCTEETFKESGPTLQNRHWSVNMEMNVSKLTDALSFYFLFCIQLGHIHQLTLQLSRVVEINSSQ